MFFARKAPTERQDLGSNSQEDKGEEDCLSSTSGDDLEAHCVKTEDSKKSTLRIRFTDYARERKKSFFAWKSAQSRIAWVGIYSMALSTISILYVCDLVGSSNLQKDNG